MKRKSPYSAILAALLSLTSFAHADDMGRPSDNAQMRNLENRVSALEQRRGANGMLNPPGRPQVNGGADLFVTADLLVWQAHELGLASGIKGKIPSGGIVTDGKVKNLDFNVDVGVRLGVGYNIPHDGWDISLTWLRFYTSARGKSNASDGEGIYPKLADTATQAQTTCTRSRSHWRMHLNQLDLDMGREFFVSKWLTLRPHFGLRTDWIEQKNRNTYNNFEVGSSIPNERVRMKDEWWGFGLEGGLDTQWGLGCGWSLYGNVATAILYGFHSMHYTDVEKPSDTPYNKTKHDSFHVSHPILDLQLGVRWDHMFAHDRFHLGIQTGWEHHIYFSQNQFPFFTSVNNPGAFVANQGDLTLQGWTLSARFDF